MEFAARNEGRRPIISSEALRDENTGLTQDGIVTHIRPNTVVMYKPTPQGFSPRTIPVTAIAQNLREGWLVACPDCKGQHGSDPNSCPGREPVAVRVCPVCGKRIYDNSAYQNKIGDPNDPNIIRDEAYEASTPASRTKMQLDAHIWNSHPNAARTLAIPPLPTPSATVLDTLAQPVRPVV